MKAGFFYAREWIPSAHTRSPASAARYRSSTGSSARSCSRSSIVYFRLGRIGLEHIPSEGPVLIAANHRSFSDPFLIGICLRRPLHFVAKVELFDKRWKAWILLALGAFPIRRGESDEEAMETARVILERGGAVGIFPEGTRVRPGPLGEPQRGVGRLALETGAPIVPVAIIGTEDIRRGWRIRPRRVTVRCGSAMTFPRPLDRAASEDLAREVIANRVWSCISLQWEWLGGLRRSATRSSSAPEAGEPRSRPCWRAEEPRFSSAAALAEQAAELRADRTNLALSPRSRATGDGRADDRRRGRPLPH